MMLKAPFDFSGVNPNAYTNDPTDVISVMWSIASETVSNWDEYTGEPFEGPQDAARMQCALDTLAGAVRDQYPNCADIYIADGGFENQFASFGPRCETTSGAIYEPFFDDMTTLEDVAIGEAFAQFPSA